MELSWSAVTYLFRPQDKRLRIKMLTTTFPLQRNLAFLKDLLSVFV